MAIINGDLVLLSIGTTVVNCQTEGSLEMSAEMQEITCKDSAGNKAYVSGDRNATLSVSGMYDPDESDNYDLLFDTYVAGAPVTIRFGETTSGGVYYTASALITSLSLSGPRNAPATWSCSLQVTGAITAATVGA